MFKKLAIVPVALILVVSLVACVPAGEAESGPEVELSSAQEIADAVIASMSDVNSYQFESNVTMDMTGEADGEALDMSMEMGFDGAIDTGNKEMYADIAMTADAPDEEGFDMAITMYVVDGTAYMKMDYPGLGGPTWVKSDVMAGDWEQMSEVTDMTDSYLGLLEAADVELVGSETVKGVDCYVLKITPDMEQLWQLFEQQSQMAEGEMPDIDEEMMKDVFRNFSVKQWVSKSTYYLSKAEITMDMEMTAETMGAVGQEGSMMMDISMTMVLFDHNQPVSIELPAEAENAIEMGN